MFDLVPFRGRGLRKAGRDDLMDPIFKGLDDIFSPAARQSIFTSDIKETEKEYILEVDLPGVEKDDIELSYENNHLTVKANRKEELKEEEEDYIRQERHYGELQRSFYVDNVKEEDIKAEFKDGVLKVILPKKKEGVEGKKVIDID